MHSQSGTVRAFGPSRPLSDIHATLAEWQKAGDPRLFKIIVSPEFGESVDLEQLTRRLMARIEQDVATGLEWAATIHSNTEHPHVHVALRGVTTDKKPVFFRRTYIQSGIRQHAEELVTAQLGRRTTADIQEAQRREIHQPRYTSLDQILSRNAQIRPNNFSDSAPFVVDLTTMKMKPELHYLKARLLFLERMGLAETCGSNQWHLRADFREVLTALAQANDRQRALAAQRSILSDARLPLSLTDVTKLQQPLEGRVIGHGEEEASGGMYMILEGTDHDVHFIYHSREMEVARHQGKLKPNNFVRLVPTTLQNQRLVQIVDFGNAETFLKNRFHVCDRAQLLTHVPNANQWAGWLGRYDAAVRSVFAQTREQERTQPGNNSRQQQRGR